MNFMFFRNLRKFLFCVILVCFVFLSISSSFAYEDMDVDFTSSEFNYGNSAGLSVFHDDLKVSSDSDFIVLGDDGGLVDDGAFNEDDPWVENLEEDSYDDESEFVSDFEQVLDPGASPMDSRVSSKLVVSSFSKYYRNGTQLVGYLQDANNNPLSGKTVSIGIVGNVYTRVTDEDGAFRLNINLKPNNYTSTISFAGDSNYKSCTKTITVKVFTMPTSITCSNLVKYYRNASQLVARLKDVHGNPLVGKNISISILGNVYYRTTDDDGYISMTINMHPRICNATLNFTENGYKSSRKVVSVTVLEMPTSIVSSNLVKHYRNGSYWVARLLDGNGNPLVGKTLTFNIDTHTYARVSDDDGYCYMTINLHPGTFTGTVSFSEQYYASSSKTVSVNVLDPPVPNVNHDSGVYNVSSLLVSFSAYLENATVFCSFDSGSTWYEGLGDLSFNVSAGNWSVLSYVGLNGYNSSVISRNFVLDLSAPFVWASNGSAIYNESFYVDLYSLDDADGNPLIYYTLDGSMPNENSAVFNESIYIDDASNLTTLRFVSVDFLGRSSGVVNVFYFFGDLVANLNSGKCFETVQGAVDDDDTFEGDIIEVSKDLDENVIMNKSVYLRSCDFKDVLWESENGLSCVVFDSVVGAIVEGFVFKNNNHFSGVIAFDNASNCFVVNNLFFNNGHSIIMDRLSVNDFYSFKDISFNNSILYNQFYGSAACINLNYCINYSIIGNSFNKNNYSLFDMFDIDYGFGDYNFGIYTVESLNSLFANNSFFNRRFDGIRLFNSTNDIIANNNFSSGNTGVNIIGNNISILNNNFTNNIKGIYIIGENNDIRGNIICDNNFGIFSEGSANLRVNFNRIANNEQFGLYILDGCVDATNNWWGSNNITVGNESGCDVYCSDNFDLIYEPYLVLNTYVSGFRKNQFEANIYYGNGFVMNYSLADVVCVADLRRNNFGEDVSYVGTVPEDNILFVQGTPILHSHFVPLVSGVGSYFAPQEVGDGRIIVIFDDEYQILNIHNLRDETYFYFNTSSVILEANSSYKTYVVNLNSDVNWVSIIWKYIGDFKTEFNMVLDGDIIDNFTVESSFYHENKNCYSNNVWHAMESYNDFLYNELSYHRAWVYVCIALDYDLSTFDEVEEKYYDMTWRNYTSELKNNLTLNGVLFNTTLLSLIKEKYNLSDYEINFVINTHLNVRDSCRVSFAYLGGKGEIFNFDLGNFTENYAFRGSSSSRIAEISCVNGAYAHMVGKNATDYEENWTDTHYQNGTVEWESGYSYGYYANAWYDGLMTFTFANDRVDIEVLGYWLNQSNRTDSNGSLVFDVGPMKAAYGSFLEGLLVIYMDDLVADAAAERYNVTWNRISPMVMSVHDNILDTYMSGECDFRFGREAYGSLDNVNAFYFACSSSFSLIEHYVGENLFPGGSDLNAVTTGLNYILEHNGTLEVFIQEGCVLIREEGNNDRVLIFDAATGLLHDSLYFLNGAFCYSNQQTDWALTLGSELLNSYGDIWSYLLGNGDLPNLSPPTMNMVKSCNFFLGMGAFFVVEDTMLASYLVSFGTLLTDIGVGSLEVIGGYVLLPIVFFASIEPVGSQNETEVIMEFYRNHDSANVEGPSLTPGTVQINSPGKNIDYYKNSRNTVDLRVPVTNSPLIPLAFYISNSGPDDENSSLIIKVTAGALISMLIAPGGLFAASGIKNNLNLTFEYDNEKEEYTITILNYEWGVSNV